MRELISVDTELGSEEEAENARREHNILINSLIKVIVMLVLQKKWAVDMISVGTSAFCNTKIVIHISRCWFVCLVRYALHFLNNRWIRSECVLFITMFLHMDREKSL